jgi:vancomycin permeability regulator SanA
MLANIAQLKRELLSEREANRRETLMRLLAREETKLLSSTPKFLSPQLPFPGSDPENSK